MTFDQIAIVICSAGSIFFLSGQRPILGFILGLLGQPFWFYAAWTASQYGVLALAIWFTFCHARGIRRQWLEIKANNEAIARLNRMSAQIDQCLKK